MELVDQFVVLREDNHDRDWGSRDMDITGHNLTERTTYDRQMTASRTLRLQPR